MKKQKKRIIRKVSKKQKRVVKSKTRIVVARKKIQATRIKKKKKPILKRIALPRKKVVRSVISRLPVMNKVMESISALLDERGNIIPSVIERIRIIPRYSEPVIEWNKAAEEALKAIEEIKVPKEVETPVMTVDPVIEFAAEKVADLSSDLPVEDVFEESLGTIPLDEEQIALVSAISDTLDEENKEEEYEEEVQVPVVTAVPKEAILVEASKNNFEISAESPVEEISTPLKKASDEIATPISSAPSSYVVSDVHMAHEKFHVLRSLSIFQIAKLLFWPFWKIGGSFYWWIKLRLLKSRQKSYSSNLYRELKKREKLTSLDPEQASSEVPRVTVIGLLLPANWGRVIGTFVVASVVLAMPIFGFSYYERISQAKQGVLEESRKALSTLESGQAAIQSMDLVTASKNFALAQESFQRALSHYQGLDALSRTVISHLPVQGKNVRAGLLLIDAGSSIAEAGKELTTAAQSIFSGMQTDETTKNLLSKLTVLKESLDFALPQVAQAQEQIDSIDTEGISLTNMQAINAAKNLLPRLEQRLENISQLTDAVLDVMGFRQWQRYLLIFQNNNELRATGGFIGSFAVMDVKNGQIVQMNIPGGGSYDLQGSLTALVASPEPLHVINPVWEFQDANWWPDFPTSANKLAWFLEKSGWPSVHGVIALTANMMERILNIVGPVDMPEYGRVISDENFVSETQKIVEQEYDKEKNQPKEFIAKLAPKILEKVGKLNEKQKQELIAAFYEGLKERQMMLYSRLPEVQNFLHDLDWDGAQKATDGVDYVSVIHTNIAGEKTDEVMQDSYTLDAQLQPDGTIINTLTLTRRHNGEKGEDFIGVQNNSYVRVYVPENSVLISAEGFAGPDANLFEPTPRGYNVDSDVATYESVHRQEPTSLTEVYTENHKTVFANWLMIKPGEEKTAVIRYRLPQVFDQEHPVYTLTFQKQAGSIGPEVSVHFWYGDRFTPVEGYPEHYDVVEGGVNFHDTLTADKFFGLVLRQK